CEDLPLGHRYHSYAQARPISRAMRTGELPSPALDEADQGRQAAKPEAVHQAKWKGVTMNPVDPQTDPLTGAVSGKARTAEQKNVWTFTILHTNDMHSNLIGVGPASEYSPMTLNDDRTIGGIERIASLIAERRKARCDDIPQS